MTVFRCATEGTHSHNIRTGWLSIGIFSARFRQQSPSQPNESNPMQTHAHSHAIGPCISESCSGNFLSNRISCETEPKRREAKLARWLISSLRKLIVTINGKGNLLRFHASATELMCHKFSTHHSHNRICMCECAYVSCVNMTLLVRMGMTPHNFVAQKQYACQCFDRMAVSIVECSCVECAVDTEPQSHSMIIQFTYVYICHFIWFGSLDSVVSDSVDHIIV